MKIEKLTENKIRVILKENDFKSKSINFEEFIFNTNESESLLLEILNKAKNEFNFDTDGCKLLIEANMQCEDILMFTITKYIEIPKKKLFTAKKSKNTYTNSSNIYNFSTFDDFCDLCTYLSKSKIKLRGLLKNTVLYLYNNTYYLIIEKLNTSYEHSKHLISTLSEFSTRINSSNSFQFKIKEHGKIIIKDNAVIAGIKYFCKK